MQKCTKKDLKHISILNIQTISEEIRKNYYFLKKILLLSIKKLLVLFVKKNFSSFISTHCFYVWLTGSHSRPCVPREPCSTSKSQYVGDSFKKTKSVSVWGLNLWNLGSSILRPRRFLCLTSWAMSNFFFKISPI